MTIFNEYNDNNEYNEEKVIAVIVGIVLIVGLVNSQMGTVAMVRPGSRDKTLGSLTRSIFCPEMVPGRLGVIVCFSLKRSDLRSLLLLSLLFIQLVMMVHTLALCQ
jgi:hypothetical protein